MFGISLVELLTIIFVALFIVKPQDMPEIARYCGKIYAKAKKAIAKLKAELEENKKEMGFDEIKQEFSSAAIEAEMEEDEKTEIIDIYGNVHKVNKIDEIRSDLTQEELKAEIEKYNQENSAHSPSKKDD